MDGLNERQTSKFEFIMFYRLSMSWEICDAIEAIQIIIVHSIQNLQR